MDEAERELWCRAWQLLREHGSDVGQFIDSEIQRALHGGDNESVARWKQLANAAEQLAR